MNKLDCPETIYLHKNLIKKKKILNRVYIEFYQMFKKLSLPKGLIVELGSGGGFIKEIIPATITTDLVRGPGIDKVMSGEKISFKKGSVAAFLMFDVFHHIKNPQKALVSMEESLKKGGKIIMIEPNTIGLAGLFYKYFHHETRNKNGDWHIPGKGRMSDANLALPWIVFIRDRELFESRFPQLKVTKIQFHTPLKYIISGGVSKPQLVPTFFYQPVTILESLLRPFNRWIGLFMTIEIKKK